MKKRFPWTSVDPKLPPAEYDAATLKKLYSRCKRLPNGCLEFQGTRSTAGYGQIIYRGKSVPTHILVHRLVIGPTPKGLDVAHSCDNPPCVEAKHLSLKTRRQNLLESVARNRHPGAIKTHCKRGHELSGDNLYVYRGSRHCSACNRGKQRVYAGWPEDLAYSAPAGYTGESPTGMVRVQPPKRRPHESSHCVSGHEIAGDNLYVSPDGYRKCRRCRSAAAMRWRPKVLAAFNPGTAK